MEIPGDHDQFDVKPDVSLLCHDTSLDRKLSDVTPQALKCHSSPDDGQRDMKPEITSLCCENMSGRPHINSLCYDTNAKPVVTSALSHVDDMSAGKSSSVQCYDNTGFLNESLHQEATGFTVQLDFNSSCDVGMNDVNRDDADGVGPTFIGPDQIQIPVTGTAAGLAASTSSANKSKQKFCELACTECGRIFTTAYKMRRHVEGVHLGVKQVQRPGVCIICWKTFSNKPVMRHHMATAHMGVRPFLCKVCGLAMSDRSNLKRHERTHTGEKLFGCAECGQRFTVKESLQEHVSRRHGGKTISKCENTDGGEYICSVCDKRMVTRRALTRHMRIHTGDTYECPDCRKQFLTSSEMRVHCRSHARDKPMHVCKYCGEQFTNIKRAKSHEQMHTGEKPYECKYCSKRFASAYYIKVHESTHTDALQDPAIESLKPFACDMCGDSFSLKMVLKMHQLNAHGVGECFRCPVCDKAFVTKSRLRDHLGAHSSEKPYACCECGRVFKWRKSFLTHYSMKHDLAALR